MPTIDSAGRQRVIILGDSATIATSSLQNGGFEEGLTSWTTTAYTGGSVAINTANDLEGVQAIGFTSTVTANGGGVALSADIKVAGSVAYRASVIIKAAAANVSSSAEIVWYTKAAVEISASAIYTSTNTPTSATLQHKILIAPATARFAKVRLIGGVPGSGSSAGTVYMDAVQFSTASDKQILASDTVVNELERKFTLIEPSSTDVHLRSQQVGRCRIKWTINNASYGTIDLKKNGVSIGGAVSGQDHDCVIGDRFTITATATSPGNDLEVLTFQLCGDIG